MKQRHHTPGIRKPFGEPKTVSDLSQRNIQIIAHMEDVARAERTPSDRIADAVAAFCGSMTFIYVHIVWFGLWIVWNASPHTRHFDPYPYQFLTLTVSLEAIFLTTFVIISQNRQARVADRRNHLDLQINLLAEQENSKMLAMLDAIMDHLGIEDSDPSVSVLKEATEPEALIEQIERVIEHSHHNGSNPHDH